MQRLVVAGILCLLGFLGVAPLRANAAPARPDFLETLVQPDGSRFEARMAGDEWHARREAVSGHTVARDDRGVWRYVVDYRARTPVLSEIVAGEAPPLVLSRSIRPRGEFARSPEPSVSPSAGGEDLMAEAAPSLREEAPDVAPSSPKPSLLYILVDFTDRAGTFPPSAFAATVADVDRFWAQASGGRSGMVPAAESHGTAHDGVVGWLRLNRNHPGSGRGSGGGSGVGDANRQVAAAAIQAAVPYVDFAAYDLNGDGYVSADELSVVVVCAGYEASYSSETPSVWAHKWSLYWSAPPVRADGVLVGDPHEGKGGYVQIGEIHKGLFEPVGHPATHGVVIHELGHLTHGLPDLYDTDGSSRGVGDWDVMGGGSWNRAPGGQLGSAPALPSAWVRVMKGWAAPLPADGPVRLEAASSPLAVANNQVVRIVNPSNARECFLIERRAPTGLDAGLGGFGAMDGYLVWHVDSAKPGNTTECNPFVNPDCSITHPLLALAQADNAYHLENRVNRGDLGDMFRPGSSFSAGSLPTARWYSDEPADILVEPLASGQGLLAFAEATSGRKPPQPPEIITPAAGAVLSSTVVQATWAHRPEATHYMLGGQALGGDGAWRALTSVTIQASSCGGGTCQGTVSVPHVGDLALTVKSGNYFGLSLPATRECSAVVPARPRIVNPADRSVYGRGQKLELTWEPSSGATGYLARFVDGSGRTVESAALDEDATSWAPTAAPTPGDWTLEISAVGAQGQGRTRAAQLTVLSGERRRPPIGVILGALFR